MPVPAQVRRVDGHRHDMTCPLRYVPVATRTDVPLQGLIRLDHPDVAFGDRCVVRHGSILARMEMVVTADGAMGERCPVLVRAERYRPG